MAMTMPQSLELRGICGVCALADSCELVADSEAPVMKCEKFEPDPALVCEMVNLAIVNRANEMPGLNSNKHMGLCENCAHREYCAFPKNEGGVWHCEEYE